jgi:hypothetical protein
MPYQPSSPVLRRAVGPTLLLLILLGAIGMTRPDGRLHVTFLNTPGDAILIQSPAGRFTLIDGGSDPITLATQLGRQMPFWERNLAAVFLTAPTGKRLPGQVAALARYRPARAFAPPELPRSGLANEWRRLISTQRIPVTTLHSGLRIDLGGALLHVLDTNDTGAVLLISYGATRVLLHTGGPAGDPAALALAGTPITLLAFPWERETEDSPLAILRPQRTVFTTAYTVDEPALRSYAERQRYSPAIYHPEVDGSITLISDGRGISMKNEK